MQKEFPAGPRFLTETQTSSIDLSNGINNNSQKGHLMTDSDILNGKKILIVDDEPDILDSLEEMLEMCEVDRASDYESAVILLDENRYAIAVLDIMGVNGYDLLDISRQKKIPAVMLTAHALSADHFVKSIEEGAWAYLPKEKLHEIDTFLIYIFEELERKKGRGLGRWYGRLKGYFERKFGPGWLDQKEIGL